MRAVTLPATTMSERCFSATAGSMSRSSACISGHSPTLKGGCCGVRSRHCTQATVAGTTQSSRMRTSRVVLMRL